MKINNLFSFIFGATIFLKIALITTYSLYKVTLTYGFIILFKDYDTNCMQRAIITSHPIWCDCAETSDDLDMLGVAFNSETTILALFPE